LLIVRLVVLLATVGSVNPVVDVTGVTRTLAVTAVTSTVVPETFAVVTVIVGGETVALIADMK
jgi:hypothetical protein